MNFKELFSEDVASFRSSPIREVLKSVDLSQIYSFAGGYPSPQTFPTDKLSSLCETVVKKYGSKVIQYGDTRGVLEFREALAKRYDVEAKNIHITSSSQQGIDICARLLLDPSDVVLCDNPCYLGALNSFYSYRAEVIGMSLDPSFEESNNRIKTIEKLIADGKKIKFFYVIPDFSNPGGKTLTLAQRSELVALARRFNFVIVEDSPYREVIFEGDFVSSIYSLAPDIIIHLGSISKIFAPGLRLGWIIAPEEFLEAQFVCKQSLDLTPGILAQYIALEFMESGELDANLEKSRKLYKTKKDKLISILEQYMPNNCSWTNPTGGLFLLVTLPEHIDATALFPTAIKKGVAYVPGSYFYADGSHRNTLRLNYSYIEDEKMEKGIKLLSELIQSVS